MKRDHALAFFKKKELKSISDVYHAYVAALDSFIDSSPQKLYFREAFDCNKKLLTNFVRNPDFNLLRDAYGSLWKFNTDDLKNKEEYFQKKDEIFSKEEQDYTWFFKMRNKPLFRTLDNLPVDQEQEIHYFHCFIRVSIFFFAAFDCGLNVIEGKPVLNSQKYNKPLIKVDYYLFYNRSHIESMDLGIGEIKINGKTASVKYYYENPFSDSTKPLDILETQGDVEYFNKAEILVLKNVSDAAPLTKKSQKLNEHVESYYVLKQVGSKNENILLGIIGSWNRKNSYPVSSAVLLIRKEYYDVTFKTSSVYQFNPEKFIREKVIVPRIFYYLYNQSITLQSVIQKKYNSDERVQEPFVSIDDIPFFEEEAFYLEKIAGTYQGLSIVPEEVDSYTLVISQLEIQATGIVELKISEDKKNDGNNSTENKGFVKQIEVKEGKGKIFISLRHDFAKHSNSLNHFLTFEMIDKETPGSVLKGAFAGISLISGKPLGAGVVYKKINHNSKAKVERVKIDKNSKEFLARLKTMYAENEALFTFYARDTENYTNLKGVQLLRDCLEETKKDANGTSVTHYDIFISMPFTSSRQQGEYERNKILSLQLSTLLSEILGIDQSRIFCACIDSTGRLIDYEKYLQNNQDVAFQEIITKLKNSSVVVFLFPERFDPLQKSISSSLIEVGVAVGLNKEIIVIYDQYEKASLPQNIMGLSSVTKVWLRKSDAESIQALKREEHARHRIIEVWKKIKLNGV